MQAGNYDNALKHALAEYNRRPENIDVNETLAWVYYNKQEYDKALPYMETAMKTNSKDPVLLCRAGLIYAKTGNKEKAKSLLGEVTKANCHIPVPLKQLGLDCIANFIKLKPDWSSRRKYDVKYLFQFSKVQLYENFRLLSAYGCPCIIPFADWIFSG